ncbi:MAG: hypothetical protein H7Y18_06830 [Clostridiaceae bacterium]|nr:hypothetical protein [Clostridiaceae bacterium]
MILLVAEIIFIIFMLTLMFIGIWGFILMMKMYNQLKYRNYILEKLSQNVYMITSKIHMADITDKDVAIIKEELKDVISI